MWQKRDVKLHEDSETDSIIHEKTVLPSRKRWLRALAYISLLCQLSFTLLFFHKYLHHDYHFQYNELNELSDAEAETLLLSLSSNITLRNWLKYYTGVAHIAGSDNDHAQAIWTRDRWLDFGIPDVEIAEYYPMLNYPVRRYLAIIDGPEELLYEAKLREDIVDEDETSKDQDAVPTFHGYSASGNVTAEIVYVNYGRLADFEELAAKGIDFTGKIALARYGHVFRGLKVKAAERFGCVGAIIFSDPADDGPVNKPRLAESYPDGPWRSPSSVQRGSVQFLSILPGDPLTPGYPATKDAPRIHRNKTISLPLIPSLPISWEDALPLLRALEGHGISAEELGSGWKGGLNGVGYFTGPTEARVNLVNEVEEQITPIWNVIGKIKGIEESDSVVIIGSHRDAWGFGGVDPGSGSAALVELAKGLGTLVKKGWRPRRTILLASWDAEEYGLVGSTEWVEDHANWLQKHCVAYLNLDTAISGSHFRAEASPSLNQLLFDASAKVKDPATNKTVYEVWRDQSRDNKPFVGKLGAGSDFVPFLDHIGITSLYIGFSGDYGVYHSNYDSFHWMEKFGDPDFQYHNAITQLSGILTLRLASQPLLPLKPIQYGLDLDSYIDQLTEYSSKVMRETIEVPKFTVLRRAVKHFKHRAKSLQRKVRRVQRELDRCKYHNYHQRSNGNLLCPHERLEHIVRVLNNRLFGFERGFIDPRGLPGRSWYKHLVYAPGLWAGYASQTFPSIIEALDSGDVKEVARRERRVAHFVLRAADILDEGLHKLLDETDDIEMLESLRIGEME